MKALALSQFNMDFPSKNYKKYQSQSKTNPLLHKVNQDAGYPQQIFTQTLNSFPTRNSINYVQQNKKNLKNFFSDRLPPKQQEVYRESFTIDPSKMFQIQKRQYQLKAATKAKLNERIQTKSNHSKNKSDKIGLLFQINDKNQDFKKKLFGNQTVRICTPYQQKNHLKGTACYLQKYTRITKKQAYHSVFGPEASATARKSLTSQNNRNQSFSRPFTTTYHDRKKNALTNFNSNSKQIQRKRLSSLIQKIDHHRQNLDPENLRGIHKYAPPQQAQDLQNCRNQMITWIRDTARNFRYQSIQGHQQKMNNIQDIEKMDEKFYQQMKNHKAKRLQNRSYLMGYIPATKTDKNKSSFYHQIITNQKNDSNVYRNQKELSISSNQSENVQQNQQHNIYQFWSKKPANMNNGVFLLKKLGRLLVDALQNSRYYGIKNKTHVYKAFWHNPDPFQKSGSYAFFKSITKGDLEAVKKFVQSDFDYVYERDENWKSPILYAAAKNQTQIVKFLLGCDVDINKKSFNKKTCLYYAIKNSNLQLVKILLQSGAIPWSHGGCNYQKMMQLVKNQKINILVKNARKIAIVIQMKSTKPEKLQLWNQLKSKIVETSYVTFEQYIEVLVT